MVLTTDHNARSVSVPGKTGKCCSAAIKNDQPDIYEESFASAVLLAMDEIDESIDDTVKCLEILIDVNKIENMSDKTNSAQHYDAKFSEQSIAERSPNDFRLRGRRD